MNPNTHKLLSRRADPAEPMTGLRWSLWSGLFALVAFATWAFFAEIDQITRAQGQIIPSSRTQVIQAPDGGVIEALLVREGTPVQRDDLLVRFDRIKAEAGYRESEYRVAALSATAARLRAEVFGGQPVFPAESQAVPALLKNQLDLLKKRRHALAQEIDALQQLRELAARELAMTEPLLATGDVSMAEVLRLRRLIVEQDGQIGNRRNRYLQDCQAELNQVEEELASARELMIQRKNQLDNTELRAPVNGTIKNVRITTLGGVLRPGDELMQIVPVDDALIVEAKVRPADVGFLRPGLDVMVKIDAYDYTIYGSLRGTLSYISADTLNEEARQGEQAHYRVQVKTASPRFTNRPNEDLLLQPGMTATVEIKTGTNTVMNYLLKPIIKTLNESLGER